MVSIYIHCACLAQWIGCVTPNVVSAGSTPLKVETKNYYWVAPLWLEYIYIRTPKLANNQDFSFFGPDCKILIR